MPTLAQVTESLRERDRANPEAAELRKQLCDAWIRESFLHAFRYDGWLTQAQAARLLNVNRGTITRAVKENKLITNGLSGRQCRIHAESLLEYRDRAEATRLHLYSRKAG